MSEGTPHLDTCASPAIVYQSVELADASPSARRLSAAQAPTAHPTSPPSEPSTDTVALQPLPADWEDSAERLLSIEMVNLGGEQEAAAAQCGQQPAEAAVVAQGKQQAADAATQRVTLNIWVNDDSPDKEQLERELAGMRTALSLLQDQLAEARAAAGEAGASQRVEAAREQGQLRAQIAKLEGAVLAGEARVKSQASEIESLKAANAGLERQLAELRQQAAATPERVRRQKENMESSLQAAQQAAEQKAAKVERLQAVVAFDSKERSALREFTSTEWEILTEQEQELVGAVQHAEAAAQKAAADLAQAIERAAVAEAALAAREAELQQVQAAMAAAQTAAAAAEQDAAEWEAQAQAMERDRQVATSNLRKAEREVDLIAKENECMLRQLAFVKSRLVVQLGQLEAAGLGDIAKLARELSAWVEREQAQRMR